MARKTAGRKYANTEYIYGNTARKLDVVPDYDQRQRERYQEEEKPERQVKRKPAKQVKPQSMDLVSIVVLTMAIAATVYVCMGYLEVQAEITGLSKTIAVLESQIMTLKNENAAALEQVNASVDLEYIYKVATEDLGMVHAKQEQVIPYASTKSDFVKQYGDVPDGKEKNLIDKILGK